MCSCVHFSQGMRKNEIPNLKPYNSAPLPQNVILLIQVSIIYVRMLNPCTLCACICTCTCACMNYVQIVHMGASDWKFETQTYGPFWNCQSFGNSNLTIPHSPHTWMCVCMHACVTCVHALHGRIQLTPGPTVWSKELFAASALIAKMAALQLVWCPVA